MQIIDNKALLIRVREPGRITSAIRTAKQLNDTDVLVKWGLEEAQILKNLRLKDVPSPIMRDYAWSGLQKPFKHQYDTASRSGIVGVVTRSVWQTHHAPKSR